jgi:hypothetical protein
VSRVTQILNGNQEPAVVEEDARDEAPQKPRRWSDLTPQQKKVVVVALVLNSIIASFTWRDMRRRPASLVRGPKMLWRVWSMLNTTGSVAYWLVGRRRVPAGTTITIS